MKKTTVGYLPGLFKRDTTCLQSQISFPYNMISPVTMILLVVHRRNHVHNPILYIHVCNQTTIYLISQQKLIAILNIFMVTSVACFTDIVLYSSTRHECLCGISTKELLQCVFFIISNCLWNVAITTVINRI